MNRTLSHVEIENFSSSLQYYRNYISKMGERKEFSIDPIATQEITNKKKHPEKYK